MCEKIRYHKVRFTKVNGHRLTHFRYAFKRKFFFQLSKKSCLTKKLSLQLTLQQCQPQINTVRPPNIVANLALLTIVLLVVCSLTMTNFSVILQNSCGSSPMYVDDRPHPWSEHFRSAEVKRLMIDRWTFRSHD